MATYNITIESGSNTNGWHLTGSDRDGSFDSLNPTININDGDNLRIDFLNSAPHPLNTGDGNRYYLYSADNPQGYIRISYTPLGPDEDSRNTNYSCWNHPSSMIFNVVKHRTSSSATTTTSTSTTEAPSATTRCLSSNVEVSIAALGGAFSNRYSFRQGVSSAAGNNGDTTFNNSTQAGSTTSIDFRILTVSTGSYVLRNVPSAHPIAFHTTSAALTYTGTSSAGTKTALDGETREYFYGDVTVTVNGDFGTISYECYYHGYMGGQNSFKFDSSCPQGSQPTTTQQPLLGGGVIATTSTTTTSAPDSECYCGEVLIPAGSLEAEDKNSVHIKINDVKYDLYHKYPALISKEQELTTSTKKMSNDSDLYVNKLSINFGSDYLNNPIVVRHNIKITVQTEDGYEIAFKYIGVNNTSTTIKDGIIEFNCSNMASSLNIRNKILLIKVKSICVYSADISCEKMPDSIALRNVINTIALPAVAALPPISSVATTYTPDILIPDRATNPGLVGWDYGLGRVASFSNCMGVQDLQDSNYKQLVQNIARWLTKNKSNPKIVALSQDNETSENLLMSAFADITSRASTSNQNWTSLTPEDITSDLDLLIITDSYNWFPLQSLDMREDTQQTIITFVNNGGAVLTAEWLMWQASTYNAMSDLHSIFPVNPTTPYVSRNTLRYTKVTHDAIVSNGLPDTWTFTPANIGGVETYFSSLKPGVTVFYNSAPLDLAATTSTTAVPTTQPPSNVPITPSRRTINIPFPNVNRADGFGTSNGFGDSVNPANGKVSVYFGINTLGDIDSFDLFKRTYEAANNPTVPVFKLIVDAFNGGAGLLARLPCSNLSSPALLQTANNSYFANQTVNDQKWNLAIQNRRYENILSSRELNYTNIDGNWCRLPENQTVTDNLTQAYWFADQGRPVDNTNTFNGFQSAIGPYTNNDYPFGLPNNYLKEKFSGSNTYDAAGIIRWRVEITFSDLQSNPIHDFVLKSTSNYYLWSNKT